MADICIQVNGVDVPVSATAAKCIWNILGNEVITVDVINNLTPAECEAFADCVAEYIDFTELTPEQITALTQVIDYTQLTPEQITNIKEALNPLFTMSTGPDDDPANATQSHNVDFGDVVHLYSPDGSIIFSVVAGSVIVGAQVNPVLLSGIAHTSITRIDLKRTANENQYTVEITWTDEDGNSQTTTDPTPVTISTVHPDAGYAHCNTEANLTNGGGGSGPASTETTFTPHADGEYIFDYSGEVLSGTGGISIGTTSGGADVFVATPATGDADGSRLTTTRQSNFTPPLALTGGVTYFISQWAGGGGNIDSHTVCGATDGLRGYISRLVNGASDPASSELGNLTVVGDDGEEYTLPLKSEQCLIEPGDPGAVAGVNANNMTGDLSDDDFFNAEIANTTGSDVSVVSIEFTLGGNWANPTANTITASFGGSTGTASVNAAPTGTTFSIALSPPLAVAAGQSVSGAVFSDTFSNPQPVSSAVASVSTQTPRMVRTYSDGETEKIVYFDDAGEPQELPSIPAWPSCPPFEDGELASIKELITECQVARIDCYRNAVGVNQRASDGEDAGTENPVLPQTLLLPQAAAGAGTDGDIVVHLNDNANGGVVEATLVIVADGVPVATRTDSQIMFGSSAFFRFGYFDFQAGVDYELQLSADATDIVIYGTTVPVANSGVTFATPISAASGVPQIQIIQTGEDAFTVVTDAQGNETGYDELNAVVPITRREWIPCPLNSTQQDAVNRLIAEGAAKTRQIDCYNVPNPIHENPSTTEVGTTQGGNGASWDTVAVGQEFDTVTILLRNTGAPIVGGVYDIQDFDALITVTTNPVDIPSGDSYVTFMFPAITVTAAIHANAELNIGSGGANTFPAQIVIPHTGSGSYAPLFNANNNESWIGSVSLSTDTSQVTVITCTDDSQTAYDSSGAEVPLDLANWSPCPDTLSPEEIAQLDEILTCCALDYTSTEEYSVWNRAIINGEIGNMVDVGNIPVSPAAVGDSITTRVDFIGPCGNVPVDITVERIGNINGEGTVTIITAGSLLSHNDNGDFRVTYEIVPDADGNQPAIDWNLLPSSYAGGAERLVFSTENPDDYINGPGAGGFNVSNPLPLTWSNSNNGTPSAFRFNNRTSFSYDTYQNNNLSDAARIRLLTGPATRQVPVCDAVENVREEVKAAVQTASDLDAANSTTGVVISGSRDADADLDGKNNSVPVFFHSTNSASEFTSVGPFITVIDGVQTNSVASPVSIPSGAFGMIYRIPAGVVVSYKS